MNRLAFALFAVLALIPAAARAELTRNVSTRNESPRNMMLEIKFGPFFPDVDKEFAGASPFADTFGTTNRLMSKVEIDYEFWTRVGILAVGGTVGYTGFSGKGRLKDGKVSADDTNFRIVPFSLDLIYRFDYLAQRWNVPLVPYVKTGFDYYIWWVSNGVGSTTARGGVFGAHVTAGLAFLLDSLAPGMAQTFDVETGVNNTFLFAEYQVSWVNDFGNGKTIDLSNRSFVAGISFEF